MRTITSIVIIIFLTIQPAFAFDAREPVPIHINDLPHRLKIKEVDCVCLNKDTFLYGRMVHVRNGIHEYKTSNGGLKYMIMNFRDKNKSKISNDAFITGLSVSNSFTNRCYTIGMLCNESDIYNAFHRNGIHSSERVEEFIHIGFRITDDCDEVHGALNEPSFFVFTINRRTLALDVDRFYYEMPGFGDDQIPFDNSSELRYSKGYTHVPIK